VTENNKQWLAWVITILATLAIALFFGVQYPIPEQPDQPVDPIELGANFSNPVDIEDSASAASPALTFQDDTDTGLFRSAADTLNVATGGTERLEIDASEISIVPPAAFSSNLSVSGLLYPSFSNLTVTNGDTITPTSTVYALDSAGAVTITLAASAQEGQPLILIGDDANTITINDTNVRTNDGGVQTIGQYDVILWIYQDSEWIEISDTANS
jgi:hypothetical protein